MTRGMIGEVKTLIQYLDSDSCYDIVNHMLANTSLSDIVFELIRQDQDELAVRLIRSVASFCSRGACISSEQRQWRMPEFTYALAECARRRDSQQSTSNRQSSQQPAPNVVGSSSEERGGERRGPFEFLGYALVIGERDEERRGDGGYNLYVTPMFYRSDIIPAVAVFGRIDAESFIRFALALRQIELEVDVSISGVISRYRGHLPFIRVTADSNRPRINLANLTPDSIARAISDLFTGFLQRRTVDVENELYSLLDNYFDEQTDDDVMRIVCRADGNKIYCTGSR